MSYYIFYSSKVDWCVKRIKCQHCFKNRKKTLMLQVWKLLCVPMVQIFTTSQHVLRVLQTFISSFTKFVLSWLTGRGKGEASSVSFRNNLACSGKCPNYLFVVAEMFLKVTLFLETYSVLKSRCSPGWPPWLERKGKERFVFWTT